MASQATLCVSPDDLLTLIEGMEGASCHDELSCSADDYLNLKGRLEALLAEHGEQDDDPFGWTAPRPQARPRSRRGAHLH